MTQLTSIKDAPIGQTVTFSSMNPKDGVVYEGVLQALGSYAVLKIYGDQTAYNEAVRQVNPAISSDLTQLTWFLITITNDQLVQTNVVFADEWITSGSLNQLALGNYVTLKVADPKENTQAIVSLLANAGYAVTILSS